MSANLFYEYNSLNLRLAPGGNLSILTWRRLFLGTPPLSDTSSWRHLFLATPIGLWPFVFQAHLIGIHGFVL